MSLVEYRLKRNFQKTSEPEPQKTASLGGIFVIQEHFASRLHYDFRLEMKDEESGLWTLKSWAVPKNLPLEYGQKRLAVQTEDHPLEYADFEGEIPPGNYGAGRVKIFDRGKWGFLKGELSLGKISFNLFGEKIKGRYIMLKINSKEKTKIGDKDNWLIWKKEDELYDV